MSIDLSSSVTLITSTDPNNNRFGTGFVIYQDDEITYLLTCAHVVDDVGGADLIDVEGSSASVVAYGSAAELDLAVLKIAGRLDKSPLPLQPVGDKDNQFLTAGFQKYGSHFLVRPLQGSLGQTVALAVRGQADRVRAWDLIIEGADRLQPGYSGSPVLDQASDKVLGIVSHRQGQGERGLAISVEALPELWPEMPEDLLSSKDTSHSNPDDTKPSPKGSEMSKPVTLFFSYAHEDEELRDELAKHLSIMRRQGIISDWSDREITAGSEWASEIDEKLNTADIILLLVSPDFIASDYRYDNEMKRALERHEAKEAVVIPVILRPTAWLSMPFSKLRPLPSGSKQYMEENARPVSDWADKDEAFLNITEAIRKVAEMRAKKSSSSASTASTIAYNIPTLRKLLKAAFDDESLDVFCFDYYRDVHDSFSQGMSRTAKIQRLIEHCERNLAFEQLLEQVKEENLVQYERFEAELIG